MIFFFIRYRVNEMAERLASQRAEIKVNGMLDKVKIKAKKIFDNATYSAIEIRKYTRSEMAKLGNRKSV